MWLLELIFVANVERMMWQCQKKFVELGPASRHILWKIEMCIKKKKLAYLKFSPLILK